jgi:hypothetical protein
MWEISLQVAEVELGLGERLDAGDDALGLQQLYYRRVSDPAYRELLETKGVVPGIQPFTKTKLNLRNL